MSDPKSTSANAVSTIRWESLKREFALRSHRGIGPVPDDVAPAATVADPNAE